MVEILRNPPSVSLVFCIFKLPDSIKTMALGD